MNVRREAVSVLVSPEILALMKSGDLEPVVILGVRNNGDGTHEMTLMHPNVVPCDDAAIDRVAQALMDTEYGTDSYKARAARLLGAAASASVKGTTTRTGDVMRDEAA